MVHPRSPSSSVGLGSAFGDGEGASGDGDVGDAWAARPVLAVEAVAYGFQGWSTSVLVSDVSTDAASGCHFIDEMMRELFVSCDFLKMVAVWFDFLLWSIVFMLCQRD